MSKLTFKCCSLQYLNQWLTHDRIYCEVLAGDDEAEKLKALQKAAAFYRVSRNLHTEHDSKKGLPRYKPLLDVIDSQVPETFTTNLIEAIERTRDRISRQYGDRGVLSLTTKFLWLRVKTPIIIYDSRARAALGTTTTDLGSYYSIWRKQFDDHADDIDVACKSLEHVVEYSVDPQVATTNYVRELSRQQWFKERVFDNYLWNLGPDDEGETTPRSTRSIRGWD
jgi:hypothetical protein